MIIMMGIPIMMPLLRDCSSTNTNTIVAIINTIAIIPDMFIVTTPTTTSDNDNR